MYLFTRTAHLKTGNPTAGMTFAHEVSHLVSEHTNHQMQVWTSMYSPGTGTVVWSSWFESLVELERISDKLATDGPYLQMLTDASTLFEGPVDDALLEPLYGAPDPSRSTQYVSVVSATPASGQFVEGTMNGIKIAERATAITGVPTMFARAITGSYGSVCWITSCESIEEFESSEKMLMADEEWASLVDSSTSCYQEDPAGTQQLIFRRAG